ncbi:MAG: hypothetical protein AO394_06130 [Candidatus Fermentibacter daniensis]|nr:MAG: hypothetical protein AO394_06130 [Candidatus Fermentibacter daniensis]
MPGCGEVSAGKADAGPQPVPHADPRDLFAADHVSGIQELVAFVDEPPVQGQTVNGGSGVVPAALLEV